MSQLRGFFATHPRREAGRGCHDPRKHKGGREFVNAVQIQRLRTNYYKFRSRCIRFAIATRQEITGDGAERDHGHSPPHGFSSLNCLLRVLFGAVMLPPLSPGARRRSGGARPEPGEGPVAGSLCSGHRRTFSPVSVAGRAPESVAEPAARETVVTSAAEAIDRTHPRSRAGRGGVCAHHLFEASAARTPDAAAVVHAGKATAPARWRRGCGRWGWGPRCAWACCWSAAPTWPRRCWGC